MNNHHYTYELACNHFTSVCMVSELQQTDVDYPAAPYPKPVSEPVRWQDIVSPMRLFYEQQAVFKRQAPDTGYAWALHYPLDTDRVEYSSFFMTPKAVQFAAKYQFSALHEGVYTFCVYSCSAVKIFVDQTLVHGYYHYLRNQEQAHVFSIPLGPDCREVCVVADDFAERDSQLYLRLQYQNGGGPVTVSVPARLDLPLLQHAEEILQGLASKSFNYLDNKVVLNLQSPPKQPVEITLKAQRVDAHVEQEIRKTTLQLLPGQTEIEVQPLFNGQIGMTAVTVSIAVDQIVLSKRLEFEYYEQHLLPEAYPTLSLRRDQALRFIAEHGVDTVQKALVMAQLGIQGYESFLESELVRIENRWDCSDFRLCALAWAYERMDGFSPSTKLRIERLLLGYRYWYDEPGVDVMWFFSENHAINFHAAQLLAGQLFPDRVFGASRLTGRQLVAKATVLITQWFERFFLYGYEEWNSSVYIPIDMIAYCAIYELARQQELRDMAERALDMTFELLARNSFKGVMACSFGRTYFKNLVGRRTNEASSLNYLAFGEGFLNQHTYCTALLALSSYEVKASAYERYHGKGNHQYTDHAGRLPVQLVCFKTPRYQLCSAQNATGHLKGCQEHMVQLMIEDCDTQIWINHPGEMSFFGNGRPSYFAGNGTIPCVVQQRNCVTLSFNLLRGELAYTHAFVPLARFDEVVISGCFAFLRKGSVYVGIYAEKGLSATDGGPLKGYELISEGMVNLWRICVSDEAESATFAQFIQQQRAVLGA